MYMVPILLATYDNQIPIDINCSNQGSSPIPIGSKWEWLDDDTWRSYGERQTFTTDLQSVLENHYQAYQQGKGFESLTLSFTRLNDGRIQNYIIDFSSMKQKNAKTGFTRQIRRN